ncbi:hypothetical protein D3C86_1776920 [compost metagenome]
MLEKAFEYFDWVESNPLIEQKVVVQAGEPIPYQVEKPRAMTIGGLALWLGISQRTWMNYREQEHLKDAVEICDQIIYTQKFELAAAELLNPLFISKHLGFTEKIEQTGTITNVNYSPEDFKRAQAELEGRLGDLD